MSPKLKIILSMVTFGTLGLFVKNIPLASGEIALYRAVIASIALGLAGFLAKRPLRLSAVRAELPWLFLSGAAIGFNWILLFESYRYTAVSISTLSYYFAPVLVTLLCPVLFRERLTAKQLVCFLFSTLGLALLIGVGSGQTSKRDLIGIGFGLGAATLYATAVLLNKKICRVSGLDRTLCQFLAIIVVLAPYVLATSGFHIGELNGRGLFNLLFLGLVHTGLCYYLYLSALKDLRGQQASILSYLDPLVAIVVSLVFLHETIGVSQIAGGVLILGFTLLNELDFARKKSRPV